jgi:hypothetical protein
MLFFQSAVNIVEDSSRTVKKQSKYKQGSCNGEDYLRIEGVILAGPGHGAVDGLSIHPQPFAHLPVTNNR